MASPVSRLPKRSRYLVSMPSTSVTFAGIVVLSVVAGTVSGMGAAIGTALAFGMAAIGATVGTTIGDVDDSSALTYRRSGALALLGTGISVVFILGGWLASVVLGGGLRPVADAVFVSLGAVFAFRLLVLVALRGPPLRARVGLAAIQPVLLLAGLLVIGSVPTRVHPLVGAGAVGFTLPVVGCILAIERWELPGVSTFDVLARYLQYLDGRSRPLEMALTTIGSKTSVNVGSISMIDASGDEKARLIVPDAHPGPFAGVGGGRMPQTLGNVGEGMTLVPHAPVDHARDPTNRAAIERLRKRVRERGTADVSSPLASEPVVVRDGSVTVVAQRMGDRPFAVVTFAPGPTDDIDAEIGSALRDRLGDGAILVDAHNSMPGDASGDGRTRPDSTREQMLRTAIDSTSAALDEASTAHLNTGVAVGAVQTDALDLGPLGIRVLATRVRDQIALYVLLDANNMTPTLRERIHDGIASDVGEVDVTVVMTTDTHVDDQTARTPPLGSRGDLAKYVSAVQDLASRAVADLEPTTAIGASTAVEIPVFGRDGIAAFGEAMDRGLRLWVPLLIGSEILLGIAILALVSVGLAH